MAMFIAGTFKTSIMLEYAYNQELNQKILYLCWLPKFERNNFYFAKWKEMQLEHLSRIKTKYLSSFSSLVQFLSFFQFAKDEYSLLIIDDIEVFLDDEDDKKITKVST